MEAEIITIGTELLLGEIVDTNTRTIALALREIGIDLYRTSTVGDNVERIAQEVRSSMSRAQAVITTGGLGPTMDDNTRQGIALAVGLEMEFRPELWDQIQERFTRFGRTPTENNRRQAQLPTGAIALENPIGTAPGFIIETETAVVIALQGVPAEMSHLLENEVIPYLRRKFRLHSVIKTRLLRTAGSGESSIDDRIQDLERLTNPTIGLAAHPGRVDIRITAKSSNTKRAMEMIQKVEGTIRQRLGTAIYGVDDETLEEVAINAVAKRNWRLAVVEGGTASMLTGKLASLGDAFAGGQILSLSVDRADLEQVLSHLQRESGAQVGLGLLLQSEASRKRVDVILRLPDHQERLERFYGGPPAYAVSWGVSVALDLLRRRLA
jgi:nicotinamide-nucleotide amidase